MDEYISKQKVLDYLNGYLHSLGNGGADTLLFDMGQRRALINSIQDLLAVKAADVQPVKHGRWVCVEAEPEKVWCDNCKTTYRSSDLLNIGADDEKVNFCPNCGARMDGDVNE